MAGVGGVGPAARQPLTLTQGLNLISEGLGSTLEEAARLARPDSRMPTDKMQLALDAKLVGAKAQGRAELLREQGLSKARTAAARQAYFAEHMSASLGAPGPLAAAIGQAFTIKSQGGTIGQAMVPVLKAAQAAPGDVVAVLDLVSGTSQEDVQQRMAAFYAMPEDRQAEVAASMLEKLQTPPEKEAPAPQPQVSTQTAQMLQNFDKVENGYASYHQQVVGQIAAAFGQSLGLSAQEVATLQEAGHTYDLGKAAIDSQRPGLLGADRKLTDEEFDFMKGHVSPDNLKPLLDASGASPEARKIAYAHHLRYDGAGRGYPAQLSGEAANLLGGTTPPKGEDIPKLARIVSIADAFHAMMEKAHNYNRPDPKKMAPEQALGIIEKEAGQQFDPQLAKAFAAFVRQQLAPPAPTDGFTALFES